MPGAHNAATIRTAASVVGLPLTGLPGYFLSHHRRALLPSLLLAALTLLSACSPPTTLERIEQEQVLHVVTLTAPGIYYQERGQEAGLEYELARRFARHLGVELRLEVVQDLGELFQRLDRNHTHLAAAGLPINQDLRSRYKVGPHFLRTRPVVIYHGDNERPQTPQDLVGRSITVIRDSHHHYRLQTLSESLPGLEWQARADIDSAELMHRVNEGSLDIAIVDSNQLAINKVYFPKVREAFPLDSEMPVAWLFPAEADNEGLLQEAREFHHRIRENGTFDQLVERYYGHLDRLDYVGAKTFVKHLENRLPRYRTLFQKAAEEYDLDWRLVAAIGYQESHWNPSAVSPTGVRGLMMLTLPTARQMGVKDRVDPASSIWGGTRYFRRMKNRLPERIKDPDRTWLALAAYNVGFGHMEDARVLTQRHGEDPDKWMDVKEHLPLLAQKKWYTQTRYGYARGWEPVIYVQNIRRYYDVLTWMYPDREDQDMADVDMESPLEKQQEPPLEPLQLHENASENPDSQIRTLPWAL
ncbi:MAG: membrane-bound lytic murein transglycosylase MltF [Oleiphilaceae bacterium]|nr:membrane-bound lytic murein transglycosylase MltF [Oleiphilaceae bacterium]